MKKNWNRPVVDNLDLRMTLGGVPGGSSEKSLTLYGTTLSQGNASVVLDHEISSAEITKGLNGKTTEIQAWNTDFMAASRS